MREFNTANECKTVFISLLCSLLYPVFYLSFIFLYLHLWAVQLAWLRLSHTPVDPDPVATVALP